MLTILDFFFFNGQTQTHFKIIRTGVEEYSHSGARKLTCRSGSPESPCGETLWVQHPISILTLIYKPNQNST